MSNEQLLEIIKIQAEIIRILGREYTLNKRNPIEKNIMDNLLDELKKNIQ